VPLNDPGADSILELAANLGELEVVIGERARPAIALVRADLREAVSRRANGDIPGALALIRGAMERLAALGSELDQQEGAMMGAIARQFSAALNLGDTGGAKQALGTMRRKAGDTKEKEPGDW
jgi:hypothetical protein